MNAEAKKQKARERTAAWRRDNPQRVKDYQKANPDRMKSAQLKKRYGITVSDYKEMFEAQGGRCKICNGLPGVKAFHVDHCHRTGKVRGLLCSPCNTRLGVLENKDWVTKALLYLQGQ